MPLNPKFSTLAVNTKCDAQGVLLNNGFLDIYDGVQPATGDTAVTTQVKLARLTFGNPAFAPAVDGVATANPLGTDNAADADGQASWFRACRSDSAPVYDGSVGLTGCNLNLNAVSIAAGAAVGVSSFVMTENKG